MMEKYLKRGAISILNRLFVGLFVMTSLLGCIKEDQAYTTFTGEVIYSYLKNDTSYTEFVKVIDKAGYSGMLSAYGSYTCLAPTNKAFRKFYNDKSTSFDKLTALQLDTIMRNHLIVNSVLVADLSDGTLPNFNMNGIKIPIVFTTDNSTAGYKILINDSCQLVSKDNVVYNGVIQGINDIIIPSREGFAQALKKDTTVTIFYKALILTGLADSLTKIQDDTYKATQKFKDEYNSYEIVTPAVRKFGYTAFVESDKVYSTYGINSLSDLNAKAKILYPSDPIYDNDFTNRKNSLNQFIAYHLVNKAVYYNTFFYKRDAVKNYTPDEFLETMLTNRIIHVSKENSDVILNTKTDFSVTVPSAASKSTINGVYHLVNKMLVYSDRVEQTLSNSRIRFDIVSLFPEMTNNNIRGSEGFMSINNGSGDRFGFQPGYLADLKMSKDTRLIYLAGKQGQWANFQADELMGLGAYDITLRLLPVPPGTYELRFGYSANANRSITQLYIDGKPIGIPLDLTLTADKPQVGSIIDKLTDDNGYENDKMMRNRGYMKAPNTYLYINTIARDATNIMRRIIGTFTFNDYQPHYLRFKSVTNDNNKQCMMDYFEYVPKNVYSPADGEPESRD